jgi:hypothetical protein
MGEWRKATSSLRCRNVDGIMATLRRAGAAITEFGDPTGQQTLDQGEEVLGDDALWVTLPGKMEGLTKEQLRDWLMDELDACR